MSDEAKEAALNAKIEAIRAKNAAREARHREIEADRLEAEKSKSAVSVKTPGEEETEGFKNPYENAATNRKKPVHERISNARTPPTSDSNASSRRGRGRLADDDGPPPDPGYSFLADRMRDGSPSGEDDSSEKRPLRKDQRPPKNMNDKKPLTSRRSGPGDRVGGHRDHRPMPDENVSPKHRTRNRIEERVSHNIREIREESNKPVIKPLMPENFKHERHHGSGGSSGGGGAQARLERSRQQHHQNGSDNDNVNNPNRKVIETGKKQMTIKVQFDPNESPTPTEIPSQPPPPQPLVASTPSWTPASNPAEQQQQWTPMPINQPINHQWQETQTGPMVIGHWDNSTAAMGWTAQPMTEWSNEQSPDYYSQHSQQYMHIPYQDPSNPMMIPMGSHPEYMTHPPLVHHGHQAMTQITHATMPIMATQQYIPPAPKDNNYYGGNNGSQRSYRSPHQATSSSRTMNWRNPEKEVTRIPPRFQKQRPAQQSYQSSASSSEKVTSARLPRASSRTAPDAARRLTIFGTSNVVNNLSIEVLENDLKLPVRLIPAMKLHDFKEKIGQVDPEVDRMVLIHGLGNDARNIALKTSKSDVDKGAESDGLANEFADIILDLVDRIPYLKVLISTLLPRFDNEFEANMSNPNNVRKVMNVEISMRLQDKPNIEFINNDTVLEWWKDDVKKMRLFGSDGYHLSAYGFSMMLEHWMHTLKSAVNNLGLKEDSAAGTPESDDSIAVIPPPTETSQKSSEEISIPKVENKQPSEEQSEPNVSESELPNLEEVTPKMSEVKLEDESKEVPLPPTASDEEEFHEASESPVNSPANQEDEEFKEKENDEKMEKEMTKDC